MTFTYTPSDTPSDLTRVRYHIEDTQSPGLLSDEEISMVIAEEESWQKAVISCINSIMSKLARESGVTLDWLRIDRKDALDHYQRLKREKAGEFGVVTGRKISSGVVHSSRYDSP